MREAEKSVRNWQRNLGTDMLLVKLLTEPSWQSETYLKYMTRQ